MIYLDSAASTKVDDSVLDLFCETTKKYYANPNSNHKLGHEAKEKIDEYTSKIAKLLNIYPEEIIYTSGASETNNLVVKGIADRYKARGKHILISSLEHNSIVSSALTLEEKGFEVEIIPVNKQGLIDLAAIKELIRDDTILVSICTVDSEIGLKQPIEEIALFLKNYPNCIFHTDAAQAIGKINVDYSNVDLITITPHKFYGMNGIGMLVKKRGLSLKPQINGGASTTIYRSGTPVVGLIASLYKALSLALNNIEERHNYIKDLSDYIKTELSKYQGVTINNTSASIPDTINFSIKNIPSIQVQEYLNKRDIYVSTKTSCCPIETPSKLVYALTKDKSLSSTSIRLSLSYLNTKEEIDEFLCVFDIMYKEYEVNGKI